MTADIALLDTNILVYAADDSSTYHKPAIALREKGMRGEIPLCVCPQVLNEFFAIITDPRRVRNPRDHEEALAEVEKYFRSKHILKIQAGPEIFEKMLELLKKYKIKGAKIFDLQLVATMLSSNITCLYTYNKEDFLCFEGIRVLIP